jgi:hypothetical protein
VAAKLPWWQRIFQGKPKQPLPAGTRPGGTLPSGAGAPKASRKPSVGGLVGKVLPLAVVVLLLIVVAAPGVRHAIGRTWTNVYGTFVYHYTPVDITSAAGAQVAGHPASNVFMGDANSFWAAPVAAPGTKARIRLTFNQPSDISLIRMTPGDPTNFAGSPRPSVIEYQFPDGKIHKALQIENVATAQKFKVSAKKATYVDLIIDSVYPVAGASYYSAIAHIEIFHKKAGN